MLHPSTFLDVTTLIAEIIALGLAASVLTGISYLILAPLLAILTRGLIWSGKYQIIRKGVLTFIGAMTVGYVILTYYLKPAIMQTLPYWVIPSISQGQPEFYYAAGIIGAQVATTYIALHSGLVNENRWSQMKELVKGRRDTITSIIIGGVISALPILVAAAALKGLNINTFGDISTGLIHNVAPWAGTVFDLAVIASAFAAVTAVDAGSAYAFLGFLGLGDRLTSKRFRWVYLIFIVASVIMVEINFNPIWFIVISQVFIALLLPAVVMPLARIAGDRKVMGEYVNPRWQTWLGYGIALLGTGMVLASMLPAGWIP
jgi:manganese transport protein